MDATIPLAKKVLIVPVGFYVERVWKAIVRSGADTIYLIEDNKEEYAVTKDAADDLSSRIEEGKLGATVFREACGFSKSEDIYKMFIGIIEAEIAENPDVQIVLDITSTPLEAKFIAYNLANAYGLSISYVPRLSRKKEIIEKRYHMEKGIQGGEPKEITPALCIPRRTPLNRDEIRILNRIERRRYNSLNEMIEDMAKEQGLSSVNDAFKKSSLRLVRDLEEKKLIKGQESGRVKLVELTDIGRAIVEGIKAADIRLKEKGLKPLMESVYA